MIDITCSTATFEHRISGSTWEFGVSRQGPLRAFISITALLFLLSAVVTVLWCNSMSGMSGMAMPGGWTMSMTWMRMSGQTWTGATVSFVSMWLVMMVAMMMPSFTPMLWRYFQTVGAADEVSMGRRTALVALGYFSMWTLLGLAIFPVGVMAASFEMKQPTLAAIVPIAAGMTVVVSGILQFTNWKKRHLACCREMSGSDSVLPAPMDAPWKAGLRFGWYCVLSCANLTAILLVTGIMNLRGMAVVTAAITAERLLPAGEYTRRVVGVIGLTAGLFLITKAMLLQ